ncbi:MAG: (d)CMP kinase [Dysgonomonas mossii]|uniref:Cytidylate kinase n=1 Tax=Dysgonomonas mossii TaxID=163665 RepID=A0A4Y9IMI9_9BACT|nr:(d)CMP kinase [Dysgonomonas mossii]MBF0762128.1 (d)CMP kinase [Dysgonomonas mossii]MBS5797526.1 (d)CMP kinase [Dysgonomonas mossii]MBS7112230.1 (d)CMP kinase [Dysgonomonas mossii]TFU88945.1 (d)CMP kinase [Dysgonomonas mossii]
MKKIVIAIDGFSSNGKSTMAKSLAREIGYVYIDSGAMYRAVTLYCIQHNLFNGETLDEEKLHNEIENIKIQFHLNKDTGTPETYLNGQNVEGLIRSMEVSSKVSIVSAIPFVRHAMVALQQEMGKAKGIVMDGRDIGTVVFPDAEMKVFVTAKAEIRAQRRFDELQSKGDTKTTYEEVLENLRTRDNMDQTRAESPLIQAHDAILLDNSYMTIDDQMQWLVQKFKQITTN